MVALVMVRNGTTRRAMLLMDATSDTDFLSDNAVGKALISFEDPYLSISVGDICGERMVHLRSIRTCSQNEL